MSPKTVLVTGATGLLGREVAKAFGRRGWTVRGIGLSRADGTSVIKVDLNDVNELNSVLESAKPQVVVHCAANRYPDLVDKDPSGAILLNVHTSGQLAQLCAQRSIFLIYISTDYVFSGREGEAPYEADAPTGPTNLYGRTKLEGEEAVLRQYKDANREGLGAVLRVPVLYGHAESPSESAVNVLMDSVWKAQDEGSKVTMDHWSLRYPTNTEDVGRVCHDVAVYYLTSGDRRALPQILQFSSESKYTKYEICQLFGEIMGLSTARIEPNTEGNDPTAAVRRPYDCHLSTAALKALGIDVSSQDFKGWWRREVRAFRK